ncbi:DUF998 domain-containing protein [Saccharomonospora sp. NPDC006951]
MPPATHRPTTLLTVRALAVVLLTVGGVGYCGWLLEFFLETGLSPLRATIDELSAVGQPYRNVFRTAEIIAGAAFVLSVPPLLRLAPVHWQARLTIGAVYVLGVLLVVRGVTAPDCAVSSGPVCTQRQEFSAGHHVHHVTSVLLSLHYAVGTGTLVLWWQGRWRVRAAVVAGLAALAWLAIIAVEWFVPGTYTGVAVRVRAILVGVAIAVGIGYLLTVGKRQDGEWQDSRQ